MILFLVKNVVAQEKILVNHIEDQFWSGGMYKSIVISIGAINIAMVMESSDCEFTHIGGFLDFAVKGQPDVSLRVLLNSFPEIHPEDLVFDSGSSWSLYKGQEKWILRLRTNNNWPQRLAIFDSDFHSGEIYLEPNGFQKRTFIFPLARPIGQIFLTNLLAQGYGSNFHSCGIIDQGEGILFAGKSGAGKSTTAELWQGMEDAKVINDDHNIIRRHESGFWLYSTPWPGTGGIALPAGAPLKQIFILKQAPQNHVKQLTPVEAASALLVRSFPPFWDSQGMDFTLRFLDELCKTVPCYELGFLPDRSIVDYVRCVK